MTRSDTWLTPPAIIEALGGWQNFDLDPCASIDQPFRTARRQLTIRDNGLRLEWAGRVWLNPPYSNPLLGRFLARLAEHDVGTALLFARTDSDAFHRFVWQRAAGVLFLRGRLRFHNEHGIPSMRDAGAPSVLVAYGHQDLDVLAAAPIDGSFVALRLPTSMMVLIPGASTWAGIVEQFFSKHGDAPIALADLYRALADHPRARARQHWQAKVRQVLQEGQFRRVDKGVWQRRVAA